MGAAGLGALIEARAAALAYYSPYYFLRQLPAGPQQEMFGVGAASKWGEELGQEVYSDPTAVGGGHWLFQKLNWDTEYFGTSMYRLFTGLFGPQCNGPELVRSAAALSQHLAAREASFYAFAVVPAEDIAILQALTAAGWQLIETRITYYRNQLSAFAHPRYPVRAAEVREAARIGKIAASARNAFDRFHADSWFGDSRADAYLARYAENAVTGAFATTVLVPDAAGLPVDAFLAISDLAADSAALNTKLSRVLLTAVGPDNRGWHLKLVAETLHRAQALGHEAVLMTTQATNHAVFRTCEKLGFKQGATSHVLAYKSPGA